MKGRKRIAHLGPAGTNTEIAAMLYDPAADLIPTSTVTAAVEAVEQGSADEALCAIENSIEGGVTETLDQLLRDNASLLLSGEVVLPIRHALVGAPDVDVSSVTTVYSHPQALAQCRRRLGELVPDASPVASLSTVAAIEDAMLGRQSVAVSNERAAELHNATVYELDIGDEVGNETRFVSLSGCDREPTGDDKTSLAFTTQHDRPGSLAEVLSHLAARGVNMTHIESRPTRRQLGTYVFLLDFQGHRSDSLISAVLEDLKQATLWMRILGSYPRWTRPSP